jgi:hypothetical protein
VILHTGANAKALCGRLDGHPDALLAGYVEQIKAANVDIQLTDHMLALKHAVPSRPLRSG